mgnify:CR=1 FL=1
MLFSILTETKLKKENEGLTGKLIQKIEFADQNKTLSVQKLEQVNKSEFLLWATPEEKAVFLGLSENLNLKEEYPAIEIKKLLEDLKKEMKIVCEKFDFINEIRLSEKPFKKHCIILYERIIKKKISNVLKLSIKSLNISDIIDYQFLLQKVCR